MSKDFPDIEENIKRILSDIDEARVKSGREKDDIKIMAVTKTVPAERINFAVSKGFTLLGENRVQEFLLKRPEYDSRASVHFIGHLQSNKIKNIISDVDMIQSADSVKLAKEISAHALKAGRVMDILCEVNIGGEESKSGFSPEELTDALYEIAGLEGVRVKGLMTIPPPSDSPVFLEKMKRLFDDTAAKKIEGTEMSVLSMGMSADYAEAVCMGSTLVRIGSALFGARNYGKT